MGLTGPSAEQIAGIAALDGGGVVVAGTFLTSLTAGTITVTAPPGGASFVAALAPDGTARWVRTLTSTVAPSSRGSSAIVRAVDARGGVVAIGGAFAGDLALGALGAASTDGDDAFVAWLDLATGTPLGLVPAGGLGDQPVFDAALDDTGVLRALGSFDSVVTIGARTQNGVDVGGNSFVAGLSAARALRFLMLQPTSRYDGATGVDARTGRLFLLGSGQTSTDVGGSTVNLGASGVFAASFVDPG